MATVTGEQPIPAAAVRPIPWIAMGWFAILIVVVYFPVLNVLVHNWIDDEDMGHAFFVPLVAGYMVWQRRERLMEMEWKPSRWGILLLVWGVVQSYIGTLGVELFLQRTAVLITFVGVLLTFGGFGVLRELAFPLLLLPFMIPIPAIVYNRITFPLQIFASIVAENILNFINIPKPCEEGNILQLPASRSMWPKRAAASGVCFRSRFFPWFTRISSIVVFGCELRCFSLPFQSRFWRTRCALL